MKRRRGKRKAGTLDLIPDFVVNHSVGLNQLLALPQRLLVAQKQAEHYNPDISGPTQKRKDLQMMGFDDKGAFTCYCPNPDDTLHELCVIFRSKVGGIRHVTDEKAVAYQCKLEPLEHGTGSQCEASTRK